MTIAKKCVILQPITEKKRYKINKAEKYVFNSRKEKRNFCKIR